MAEIVGILHCQYYSLNYLFFKNRRSTESKVGNMEAFITRSLQKWFRLMNCQLLALTLEKTSWCLNIPSAGGVQMSISCVCSHPIPISQQQKEHIQWPLEWGLSWETICGTLLSF